jgi:putative peptidoglycan lipid II flippase
MPSFSLSLSRLFGATVIVTGLTLGGSVLNFVAQATLAYRFGAGAAVDAYSYVLSLPVFLSGLAGIIISYTAVPLMAKSSGEPEKARMIGQSLSAWLLAICATLIILGIPAMIVQSVIVPPAKAILVYPGLNLMIFLAWVASAVQLLTALAVAQLNADGRPIVAATLGLSVSTGTIVSLILFPHAAVTVALGGMLAGSALGAGAGFYLARRRLLPPRRSEHVRHDLAQLAKSALWAVLALSCFASYLVIDAIWASRLGEGALAAMGYAQRISIGIGGLAVAGPSALLIPRLARLVDERNGHAFRRFLLFTVGLIAAIGSVCAFGIFFAAPQIVQLLFQRGAFDSADALLVSTALRHMSPGIWAMLISVILLRAIFCLPGLHFISALLGALFSLSYFVFSWLMLDLGIAGLANSYSISWIAFALCNLLLILRKSRFVEAGEIPAQGMPA